MAITHAMAALFAVSLTFVNVAAAQGPAVQFSAEAVQKTPDNQLRTARMYVGQDRVRMEYEQGGRRVAELVDTKQGRALLLMLDEGTYMEQVVPPQPAAPLTRGGPSDTGPCEGIPQAHCQHLGRESLSGRVVDKWEMLVEREGKSERSLHWIDAERNMPLRQFWPDGGVTELKPLGVEHLNGRTVEKWEQQSSRPDGETMRALQWYDPELKIAIREELPGGYFRELKNIQVAPQPAYLFEIPTGMRRVEMPVRPREQTGLGQQPPPPR